MDKPYGGLGATKCQTTALPAQSTAPHVGEGVGRALPDLSAPAHYPEVPSTSSSAMVTARLHLAQRPSRALRPAPRAARLRVTAMAPPKQMLVSRSGERPLPQSPAYGAAVGAGGARCRPPLCGPTTSLPPLPLQIYVPPHALIKHWLGVMRSKDTPSAVFRSAASGGWVPGAPPLACLPAGATRGAIPPPASAILTTAPSLPMLHLAEQQQPECLDVCLPAWPALPWPGLRCRAGAHTRVRGLS